MYGRFCHVYGRAGPVTLSLAQHARQDVAEYSSKSGAILKHSKILKHAIRYYIVGHNIAEKTSEFSETFSKNKESAINSDRCSRKLLSLRVRWRVSLA